MPETLPYYPPLPLEPAMLATSVIEAELIASVAAQGATVHQQLRLLLTYDQRGAWVANGATSCAAWWAQTADIELSTARDQMRVARAIDKFDVLEIALESQRLSYTKVRCLARHATEMNVRDLIDIAEKVQPRDLGRAIAAYNAADMSADDQHAQQVAGRSVSWRTDDDGMYVLTARLLPIDGSALFASLEVSMMRGAGTAGDLIGQQRYDSFVRHVTDSSGSASDAAGLIIVPQAEVVVHVTVNCDGALVHTLGDGTALPGAQASELKCGATPRALVHDSGARPIDVSPSAPRPSKRQLTLIKARDKHCQYASCNAVAFLHAHHIQYREDDGPTVISNLTLVCAMHHRYIHSHDPGWIPDWKVRL